MSNGQEDNALPSDIFVCSRLKQERERKRLSQLQVAEALGVTSKTVWRWEKEIPIPSDKLNALQQLGFDVVFILTGQQSIEQMMVADIYGAQNELRREGLVFGVKEVAPNDYIDRKVKIGESFDLLDEQGKAVVESMIDALLTKK